MITFKQFLEESRSAPLYHGTSMPVLRNILVKKQGIQPRTRHTHKKLMMNAGTASESMRGVQGVSASRNMHFASLFRSGFVLELDQRLLAQRYKIVPIQYFQSDEYDSGSFPARSSGNLGKKFDSDNEYEEFIVTNKPIPVQFIKRLWIDKKGANFDPNNIKASGFDKLPSTLEAITQEYGSGFVRTF